MPSLIYQEGATTISEESRMFGEIPKSEAPCPCLQGEDIVYSVWKHTGTKGFVSMLETFLSRTPFKYGIAALDDLLKTDAIPDSFLEYDEQLLVVLKAAGIPGPDAYAAIKAVKKKKADKVASYKERFKEGFAQHLKNTENVSDEKASEIVEQIWTIIENAANYMFQQGTFMEQSMSKNTVNLQMQGVA